MLLLRLQPRCCTVAQHAPLRSLFAFLLSASPVRIAAECPPSVRARLSGSVIGCVLQFPAILQYLSQAKYVAGAGEEGQQAACAIFDAEIESVGFERSNYDRLQQLHSLVRN
jgi:hypothetical protein